MKSSSQAVVSSQSRAAPGDQAIPITSDADIVIARQKGRELALQLGFQGTEPTLIAAAISEVARNIVQYAGRGEIILRLVSKNSVGSSGNNQRANHQGIMVVARDRGPGIRNIEQALQVGYSTSASLGLGLPGARRLMDEFHVASQLGRGTTVTMTKWRR